MFGLRSDGVKVKGIDSIDKIVPHIMKERSDAMNYTVIEQRVEGFDSWIDDVHARTGVSFNYMNVMIASIVRLYATRPRLNRFVMNGRIFQRNGIYASFTVKQTLKEDAPDLTIKIRFTGQESVFEVKEKMEQAIREAITANKENGSTKVAGILTAVPNGLIKFLVGTVKWMDKHGIIPGSILKVSPFHTSFYLTNLKSVKGDWVFHHLYNFGTVGLFVSMGKEKLEPVVENGALAVGKVMKLGITMDERYCDGFYFVQTLKAWRKILNDPSVLENRLDIEPVESKKERKKRLKEERKAQKSEQKEER